MNNIYDKSRNTWPRYNHESVPLHITPIWTMEPFDYTYLDMLIVKSYMLWKGGSHHQAFYMHAIPKLTGILPHVI